MARLIQSKQIEGIVTASVVEGDFSVQSGSVDLTSASGVSGSFSGSFIGDGSGISGVQYSNITGTPIFKAGSNVTIASSSNVITVTSTGGGGGASTWNELNNIPGGLISGSTFTNFSESVDSRIIGISASGSGADWNVNLQNIPSGLVSASSQITITESQISDLNHYTDSDVKTKLNTEGVVSGSVLRTLDGTDVVSGSVLRTLGGTNVLSSSVDFQTYSSSVDSRIDTEKTRIDNILSGANADYDQFVEIVNLVNSTDTTNDVAFANHYTSSRQRLTSLETTTSSLQSQVDSLTSVTSSYLTGLPSGIVSGSVLRTLDGTGVFSGSLVAGTNITINQVGDNFEISSSAGGGTNDFTQLTNVPSGLVSGSVLRTLDGTGVLSASVDFNTYSASVASTIDSIQHTQIPTGTISSSAQVISSLPSGVISGSTQITDGSGIVSGSVLRTLDGTGVVSGSVLRTLDGTGVVSGSVLRTLDGTGVFSGSLVAGNNITINQVGDNFEISSSASGGGSVPAGTVSSSLQTISHLGGTNIFSGSVIGQGTITITSGSGNITISGSGGSGGGGDVSFNGNRVVSNTDLGDLYTNSFNAGTSGSIQDFLTAVFFPSEAPTATFTNQSANFNTNLATNNTNLVSVSLTDTVDNSPYSLTLSGTNASSLTAVPTNSASSSWEIRANGNLSAGSYSYDVTVGDSTNTERTYSGRSISIAQANTGSFSTTGTLYIIESATSGPIYLSSTGRSGAQGGVSVSYSPNYGSQVATNFQSSNSLISINSSSGVLSVGDSISGSGNVSGDTITSTITYNDQYGNSGSEEITVNVTTNNAPTVASTQISNNNTNQARNTNLILQLTITDTEGDSIPNSGLVFSGYNTTYFSETITTPYMQLRANNTNVPAGTYPYTASLSDVHGFSTREVTGTFTINTPDDGTNIGDSSIYIIESAESSAVFRDATGFGNGNAAQVVVSFSPNYGSQAVQSFTSSNPAISIDSSGNLTLGVDLSGSVTQSGDTFTSTIGWTDQYSNTDSTTITATVFGNQSPSVSFTDLGLTTDTAVSGAHIGTLTITDTESDTPFSSTIGGTDGGKFEIVPQNANSSSYYVYPTGSLTQGDYSVQFVVTDDYSESATLNETISVSNANNYGKVYIYTSTRTGGGTLSDGNYDGLMGITSENTSFEPDLITGYQSVGPSPIYEFKTGELGTSSITVGGGTMTLRNTVSGSNLDTIISSSFNGNGSTAEQIMIIFPSGSDMDGIPTSMTDSLGGSTNGEYVLYLKAAGESSFNAAGTQIHMFDVDTAVEGFTRWNIIGRNSTNTASSYEIRLIPSSGSAP